MDAETRRLDDQSRLYREALITGSYIAADMGARDVAVALRRQASRACPFFGPVPGACNDNGESGR
jgi:hypothetical protein